MAAIENELERAAREKAAREEAAGQEAAREEAARGLEQLQKQGVHVQVNHPQANPIINPPVTNEQEPIYLIKEDFLRIWENQLAPQQMELAQQESALKAPSVVRSAVVSLKSGSMIRGAKKNSQIEEIEFVAQTGRKARTMAQNFVGTGSGIPIILVQTANIKSFGDRVSHNPQLFIDSYEQMHEAADDQAKIESLAQYLESGALDWWTVLKRDLQWDQFLDTEGALTNKWEQLTWNQLKKFFVKEFAEIQGQEIMEAMQKSGQLGGNFIYRMTKLHSCSPLDLDETLLAALIVSVNNACDK